MNINYKENGERKSFSCKSQASNHVPQCGEHDSSAHNENNGDFYDYPSLSHFTDEH